MELDGAVVVSRRAIDLCRPLRPPPRARLRHRRSAVRGGSPRIVFGIFATRTAAAKPRSARSASYVTRIERAAWSACSWVSASTRATAWPFQWILVILQTERGRSRLPLAGKSAAMTVSAHSHVSARAGRRAPSRAARVDRADATLGNGAVDERGIRRDRGTALRPRSVPCPNLQRAVHAREGFADGALAILARRRRGRAVDGTSGAAARVVLMIRPVHRLSSAVLMPLSSLRQATMVRFASSILNALSRKPRADRSSASAAAAKRAVAGGRSAQRAFRFIRAPWLVSDTAEGKPHIAYGPVIGQIDGRRHGHQRERIARAIAYFSISGLATRRNTPESRPR